MTDDLNIEGRTDRPTDRTPSVSDNVTGQRAGGAIRGHEGDPERRLLGVSRPAAGCPRSTRPKPRHRGPGQRGLLELLDQLSPRDHAVLDLIGEHRFLTSQHIEGFCFADHATPATGARVARRVLQRLERDGLIECIPRRVGGIYGGSSASIWMLTSVGRRMQSVRDGKGPPGKVRIPGERFIAHYLAIADVRLELVTASRSGPLEISRLQIEPVCWRSYQAAGGQAEILKPDLAVVTAASADAEDELHLFLECDRGTESIPTLIRQCHRYEDYRRSGIAQRQDGVFPLIVWLVPTERRAQRLREALRQARGIDPADYRVLLPSQLLPLIEHVDSSEQPSTERR